MHIDSRDSLEKHMQTPSNTPLNQVITTLVRVSHAGLMKGACLVYGHSSSFK